MTDSRAAVGLDRLPWLDDVPKRQVAARRTAPALPGLLGWLVAAILLVACGAYWLGMRSAVREAPSVQPPLTVQVPTARPQQPAQPQVRAEPLPEVEPVVAPPMPVIAAPRRAERPVARTEAAPAETASADSAEADKDETAAESEKVEAPAANPSPTTPWPVRVTDGASGRLVRIGAFSTARQAKKGWWAIVRNNPALKRLPALVVPVQSQRNGRVYYRIQMGTTSQAHSTVLCQRMRMIGQSCVVIEVMNRGSGTPAS